MLLQLASQRALRLQPRQLQVQVILRAQQHGRGLHPLVGQWCCGPLLLPRCPQGSLGHLDPLRLQGPSRQQVVQQQLVLLLAAVRWGWVQWVRSQQQRELLEQKGQSVEGPQALLLLV